MLKEKISYTASNCQSGILHPFEPDLVRVLNTIGLYRFLLRETFCKSTFFLEFPELEPLLLFRGCVHGYWGT